MKKKEKLVKSALGCALAAMMAMGAVALPAKAIDDSSTGRELIGEAQETIQKVYLSDIDWEWAYAGLNSAAAGMYNDAVNLPDKVQKPKKDMRYNGNGNPMYLSFDACVNEYNETSIRNKETSVQYQKGLGAAACSEIVYRLDNQYDVFETVCGFDVYTMGNRNRPSSVQFKVLGSRTTEESGEYEVLYDSGVVYNSDKAEGRPYFIPETVRVNVKEYKFLKLWVSDAGETGTGGTNPYNQSDDIIWADAKLMIGEEEPDFATFNQVLEKARELSAAGEQETVVPAIKEYFESALENAEKVALNEKAASKEVDEAWNRLLHAVQLLSFKKGDKAALQTMVDDADLIEQGSYTDESYRALKDAIAAVRTLLEDTNALAAQITKAQQDLQNAVNQLKETEKPEPLPRRLLKQSIDEAELAKENYPKDLIIEVQEKFEAALEHAKLVYQNKNADDDTVYAADDALVAMLQYLAFTANIAELDNAIQEAKDIIASGAYANDEQMSIYQEKLQAAISLRAEEFITDTEIVPVIQALTDARENLNPAPAVTLDIERLKEEIATCEAINLNKYLDLGDTKAAFTAALQAAKDVRDRALGGDETLTQNDVDSALKALHGARGALRLIPNKEALKNLLEQASAVELNLYTKESGVALTQAVKAAKAVYDNPLATEEEVAFAAEQLSAAIDDLEPVKENPTDSSGNSGGASSETNGGQTGDALPVSALLLCVVSLGAILMVKRKEKR